MQLKTIPEDFIVVEVAQHSIKDAGSYALFEMTKRNLTTERALTMLADSCGIQRRHLGYAGSKDSRALTKQYITAKIEHNDALERVKRFSKPPMLIVRFLGFVDEPLGLGNLEKNRFEIVVRDIGDESMHPLHAIPNYFDEQRFSAANAVIGKAIVKKEYGLAVTTLVKTDDDAETRITRYLETRPADYIGALRLIPKNNLLMYVHSYQSLLYNEVLRRYILDADKAATEIAGPVRLVVPSKDLENKQIPIFGFGTEHHPVFGAWYEEILAREGIEPRDFVNRQLPFLTVEGGARDAFFTIADLDIGPVEDDDVHAGKKKQRLTFTLPKGCYATMVVKCLYRVGRVNGEKIEE